VTTATGKHDANPIFSGIIRGMLPMFLLTLIEQRARHGSELMAACSRMTAGAWQPSPGSVYPLLRRLEGEGLLSGEWRSGRAAARRVYAITAAGRRALPEIHRQLLAELERSRTLIDTHIAALQQLIAGEDVRAIMQRSAAEESDG